MSIGPPAGVKPAFPTNRTLNRQLEADTKTNFVSIHTDAAAGGSAAGSSGMGAAWPAELGGGGGAA